jgi:hypothetical protein
MDIGRFLPLAGSIGHAVLSILLVEALSPNTRRSSRHISVALQLVT